MFVCLADHVLQRHNLISNVFVLLEELVEDVQVSLFVDIFKYIKILIMMKSSSQKIFIFFKNNKCILF